MAIKKTKKKANSSSISGISAFLDNPNIIQGVSNTTEGLVKAQIPPPEKKVNVYDYWVGGFSNPSTSITVARNFTNLKFLVTSCHIEGYIAGAAGGLATLKIYDDNGGSLMFQLFVRCSQYFSIDLVFPYPIPFIGTNIQFMTTTAVVAGDCASCALIGFCENR